MNEYELIKNYFQKLTRKTPGALNLNDDVFFDKKNKLVMSVDTYTNHNHFIDLKKPDLVIKKILRSSISDLICKGVKPKYYFISGSGNKKNFSKLKLSKISKSLNQEQNRYKIFLGGGDTVFSNQLSFSISTIGYSKKIIYRNKTNINDDIYVTGTIGDSYTGLLLLKKKLNFNPKLKNYFINSYFKPDIKYSLIKFIQKFAHSTIDISDGLLSDLNKMINKQNLSYKIYLNKVPISKNLLYILKKNKLLKKNFISNGDDYQVLFSASKSNRRIIENYSKRNNENITRIGKIIKNKGISSLVDINNSIISLKNKGYSHKF